MTTLVNPFMSHPAAAGGGGALLEESWNYADSGSMNGDLTWTEVTGNYDIVSAKASAMGLNSRNVAIATTNLGSSDMWAEVDVTVDTNVPGAGLMLCSDGSTQSGYYIEPHYEFDSVQAVRVVSPSSASTLATDSAWVRTLSYHLRAEVEAGVLSVWIDGVLYLSGVTDGSPLTGTYAGLRCFRRSTGAGVQFDNFKADVL